MTTKANEICRMDAVTLAARVRAKELSAGEVVDAVIAHMEQVEPHVHAFCTSAPDYAREAARKVDARIAAGEDPGPLAGVPVGIKDLVCTKDLPTVSGSIAYKDFMAEEDDVVVERLRDAGAVVLGKTNVPEFGYSGASHNAVFEATRNPWNLERAPGGSSAGSGAAVAAGVGPLAVGSDGGGSVRIPASFCGLVGVKASMGRVPLYPGCRDERYPGVSSWEGSRAHRPLVADGGGLGAHALGHGRARTTATATRCPPPTSTGRTWPSDLKGCRVAYSADWGYAAVDSEVRQIVGDAARVFESELGCTVEEADPGWDDPYLTFWGLVAAETDLAGMRRLVAEHGAQMTPHLVDFITRPWTAEDLTNSVIGRKAVVNKMWRFMRNYDFLLTPTLACPPFGLYMQGPEIIEGRLVPPFAWLAFTFPLNMTGQPAASVPAGWTADGLPVGLQIVGRHLDDAMVLRAAAAFEAVRPWRDRWPALVS